MTIQTLTQDLPTCGTSPCAAGRAADSGVAARSLLVSAGLSALPASRAEPPASLTEAGRRAAQRRRARISAYDRPPSGMLPSSNRTAAVVTADRGDQVDHREFRPGRWARLVSTVSVLVAAVIVGVVLLSSGGGSEVIGRVTVVPGDTLWSIAQQADPGADARAVVDRIRELNRLGSDAIAAGAVLKVPTAGR